MSRGLGIWQRRILEAIDGYDGAPVGGTVGQRRIINA
jgi:hypothetical protein